MYKHHFYLMEVWIKTLTGASLQLLVSPYDSIYNVKFRIQKLEGIPMSQQHLIWQGEELEDDRTLHEYHIHNGATLQLVLGMRGGPVNTRRVPSEEPTIQDMADVYLAEYLADTRGELMSPSGRRPVTYIVYQTGDDHFNLYCLFDREGSSSASNHHELLCSGAEVHDDEDSPLPGARREENEKTREKMQLVRSQMENMSLKKERKAKVSRKAQSNRPPSSRSVSRQKTHRLTSAANSARPPSVFNKNTVLPPIGTARELVSSYTPGSDSSASVPFGLSTTPATVPLSRAQCSSTLPPNAVIAGMSPVSGCFTVMPGEDDVKVPAQTEHVLATVTESATAADHPENDAHESRHCCATGNAQQKTCTSSFTPGALAGDQLSHDPRVTVSVSESQKSSGNAGGSGDAVLAARGPECCLSPEKVISEEIVDLPLVSAGSAAVKLTDAACQCDVGSSTAKFSATETQSCDTDNKCPAATADDPASSIPHPLANRPKNADWLSKELVSGSSIIGFSPSPSRRLCSGASSKAARAFHGLNAHEMQTMSNVLNTLARSQSRVAGANAAGTPTTVTGAGTGESRVPTTERVRVTSARGQLRKLSAGRSRGSSGFRLPSVKMAVRKKSATKRCGICGKKTRLANGFQCRCGNNFCTLHRYAEAHACTYDYKSEGRKLIEQNNPVITAPKLPKI